MNILVIKSSVNEKKGAYSSHLSDIFVDFYSKNHPEAKIEVFDLNKFQLASTNLSLENYENGSFYNEVNADFWIDKLKSVDKVVFSTSMTNFNYSATTKNFFDAITLPNKTFTLDKKTGKYTGLLNNIKNVQILTAQGAPIGWYPFGDHTSIIKQIFEFLGANVSAKPFVLAGTKLALASQKTVAEFTKEFSDSLLELAQVF
ncbi:FMN-dependent NADH-azoreductase [Mycoplasma sp. 'Moose RK']|uniref:FMN-dependent NADH-azoreductase n=1 Tax=Mycoplasma sp. 'Moose RK' TaxID=2780095 RepID=UPI0018C332F1|nr:FMN-dependent NADH-azoreductase [Mycoplasma sp. 'Moose RK']MBG0730708.1 FMN-dependent NADH-azoreductase [Mycoplasma sp. 'Moose RK']